MWDLTKEDGMWNWQMLGDWLTKHIKKNIAVILPLHSDNAPDARSKIGGHKVKYGVSCMYNNVCGFSKTDVHATWCRIWKLKVQFDILCGW